MQAFIKVCLSTMADLAMLNLEIDREKILAADRLRKLASAPSEEMKHTVVERAELEWVVKRLIQTRLECANFRGILRARLNEFYGSVDPAGMGGMGGAGESEPQRGTESAQGESEEGKSEPGNLDAGL